VSKETADAFRCKRTKRRVVVVLVYDGSFEGYLSLVHDVYYKKLLPQKIVKKYDALFFDEVYFCQYDQTKADAVLEGLKKRFCKKEFQTVLHIFLCDETAFEIPLLEFIRLGFTSQKELQNIGNKAIFFIRSLEKKLLSAYHRYTGFLRFEELADKTLYAKIESHYNLLSLLGGHFAKRLHTLDFIIHDVKRSFAFLHVKGEVNIRQVAKFDIPELSINEIKIQKLWKEFFAVSIRERKNEKLQKSNVALHYRLYMNEFF
jgi:probable DNA metabolism protein